MSWSDDFAGHTTGDIYGGESNRLQLGSGASTLPKHHVFPQALRSWFSSRNLQNIDDYTIQISKGLHKQLHSGGGRGGVWNSEWQQFKNQNPYATPQQIFKQAEDMMFKYQLEFSRFVKYK